MKRDDLELYVMGLYDGDVAALERELAEDPAARAIVADEARLDLLLRDAGAAAVFCPACDDLVRGARCDACGAAVRPGGYTVERVLVSNAHGRMYAARDLDGKQVALKELAFIQTPAADALAAFEREAKFLRALEHPAIPRFCASFQEGEGIHARYYLAQELVAGEALDDRLEAHWFSEAEILGIARQVLDVLVYLQGLSPMVIHRDIKPANLLARPDGAIAVVDFGAAHVHGATAASTAIGTFGYMPIEQLAGEVDATTDLYALGASLIHLLTRREPWRILQHGLLADAELNVSRPVRAFIARLVAPNPRDRFRSAAEARAALDRLDGGRLGRGRRGLRWLPSRRVILEVAAAAVVLAGAGGFATWKKHHRAREDARAEEALGKAAHARDEATRAGDRARDSLARATFAELASEMCRCADLHCTDDVTRRITDWGRDMAPHADWSQPDVMKQFTKDNQRLTTCLSRIVAMDALRRMGSGDTDSEDDGPASTSTATSTTTSTSTSTTTSTSTPGAYDKLVRLPLPGVASTALHDAVQAIGRTCDMNLVLPGAAVGELLAVPALPPLRCDRALDVLARRTGLSYEVRGAGIVEVGRPIDLTAEHGARARRMQRGIVDDPLPPGQAVDLDFRQAPIRDVVQLLAGAGGVEATLPTALGGTVTIHVRRMAWDRALVVVLETASLGYRYQAAGKRLRIAPLGELDAERERTPHGLLEVSRRADTRVAIDGIDVEVAAGIPLRLAPGSHRVSFTRPDGHVSTSVLEIAAGRTAQLHD